MSDPKDYPSMSEAEFSEALEDIRAMPKLIFATVPDVLVWLREQGVGEELHISMSLHGTNFINDRGQREPGRYLVIPLDTEPPKESE